MIKRKIHVDVADKNNIAEIEEELEEKKDEFEKLKRQKENLAKKYKKSVKKQKDVKNFYPDQYQRWYTKATSDYTKSRDEIEVKMNPLRKDIKKLELINIRTTLADNAWSRYKRKVKRLKKRKKVLSTNNLARLSALDDILKKEEAVDKEQLRKDKANPYYKGYFEYKAHTDDEFEDSEFFDQDTEVDPPEIDPIIADELDYEEMVTDEDDDDYIPKKKLKKYTVSRSANRKRKLDNIEKKYEKITRLENSNTLLPSDEEIGDIDLSEVDDIDFDFEEYKLEPEKSKKRKILSKEKLREAKLRGPPGSGVVIREDDSEDSEDDVSINVLRQRKIKKTRADWLKKREINTPAEEVAEQAAWESMHEAVDKYREVDRDNYMEYIRAQRNKKFRREVRMLAAKEENLIPRAPFDKVVKELLNEELKKQSIENLRINKDAVNALQASAELFLTEMFTVADKCAKHDNRASIRNKDFKLMRRIGFFDDNKNIFG